MPGARSADRAGMLLSLRALAPRGALFARAKPFAHKCSVAHRRVGVGVGVVRANVFDALEQCLAAAAERDDARRSERAYLDWPPEDERTVFRATSAVNGDVRIAAFGPFRSLRFNDVEQGLSYVVDAGGDARGVRADDGALPYEYLRVMTAVSIGLSSWRGVDLVREGGRLMYIGLGAGAAPAFAQRKFPMCDVCVVEIDPMIIDIVREHHGLDMDVVREFSDDGSRGDGRLRVVLADCATTMRTCAPKSLDVIFMDAFDGDGEIPAHLIEDDFLSACAEALTDGGSLVLNMFNGVRGSPARDAVATFARTLARVIGPVCSFPVIESPVNVVLSATKRKQGERDRPSREDIARAAALVGEQSGFEWNPKRLVEGAFWVEVEDKEGGDMKEVVAGAPGILGKFRGRNGTIMPREFLVTLDDE